MKHMAVCLCTYWHLKHKMQESLLCDSSAPLTLNTLNGQKLHTSASLGCHYCQVYGCNCCQWSKIGAPISLHSDADWNQKEMDRGKN